MATKQSVRKKFFIRKKMENIDHENLPEQPTSTVEKTETVVDEPETAAPAQESEVQVKSGSPCPECNGTGLIDSSSLCSKCEGSGQV